MKNISCFLLATLIAFNVNAAEELYSQKPSRLPMLAEPGAHSVGVKTIAVVNPNQLDTTDFSSMTDRKLTLEVWYPAKTGTGKQAVYRDVTRLGKAFSIQGHANRDAAPLTNRDAAPLTNRDAAPLADGKHPLVVLSHGYTGYRTIMFYLGEHLASHGYVVVSIDHTDSTNADIDFKNAPFAGFPSTLLNRARDQQFVLDKFSETDFALSSITDTNKAAVMGYSMGGFGAVNTVGGCYQFTKEGLMRLGYPEDAASGLAPLFSFCNAGKETVDARWKAMVAFAPWGQELQVHQPDALANIKVPTLYVSGDHDDISGYKNGVKKLFEQTSSTDNFLLTFREARHNIAPHPAPQIAYVEDIDLGHYEEPVWDTEILNRVNQHFSLAFLDCYVKGAQDKCDYLPKRENSNQVKQAEGKLTAPWPGFPDRWGMGLTFERGDKSH